MGIEPLVSSAPSGRVALAVLAADPSSQADVLRDTAYELRERLVPWEEILPGAWAACQTSVERDGGPLTSPLAAMFGALALQAVVGDRVSPEKLPRRLFSDEFMQLMAAGADPEETKPLRHVNLGPIAAATKELLTRNEYSGYASLLQLVRFHHGQKLLVSGDDLHALERRVMVALLTPAIIGQVQRFYATKPNPADYLYGRAGSLPTPPSGVLKGYSPISNRMQKHYAENHYIRIGSALDPAIATAVFLTHSFSAYVQHSLHSMRKKEGPPFLHRALAVLDENLALAARVGLPPSYTAPRGGLKTTSDLSIRSGAFSGMELIAAGARELRAEAADDAQALAALRRSEGVFVRYAGHAVDRIAKDARSITPDQPYLPRSMVTLARDPLRFVPAFDTPDGDPEGKALVTRCPGQAAAKHVGLYTGDPHVIAWVFRTYVEHLERALRSTDPGNRTLYFELSDIDWGVVS